MGIFGIRLDIFCICWFLGMGMVNFLDASTGVFGYQIAPKYNITEMQNWPGIKVGTENETVNSFNSADNLPDIVMAIPGMLFSLFTYTLKAANFFGAVLWNCTFGLHTYLRDYFGIPYMPWGIPIMILVNLVNFLGLVELWTGRKP